MATKIPQNIDKEDKLVGPLTLKQFLYILGGAAVVFLAYQYYVIGYLYFIEFVLISIIPATLAILLAFAKINGRPFLTFVINLGGFIMSPKRWLWQKDDHLESATIKLARSAKADVVPATKIANKSQIEQLARILDTGGKMEAEGAPHEIDSFRETPPPASEADLGVEDILSDLDK